jgi:hypothetical protein
MMVLRKGKAKMTTNEMEAWVIAESANDLKPFMGKGQLATMVEHARTSEEKVFFIGKLVEMAALVAAMPKTYDLDGKGDEALVTLHYFAGGSANWYITEKDASAAEGEEPGHHQAFGLADLGYGPELGYISIPELLEAGAELDLHFTPKTLGELKAKKYKEAA